MKIMGLRLSRNNGYAGGGSMKCKFEGNGIWEGRCVGTKEIDPCKGHGKCKSYRPDYQTNADRIRAMSDEELTVFIDDLTGECVDCENSKVRNECPIHKIGSGRYCEPKDIMSWLRQPAEGEQHE